VGAWGRLQDFFFIFFRAGNGLRGHSKEDIF